MNNPLLEAHEEAGGEMQAYGEVEIVSTFGQPQAEYAAIRKSVGVVDFAQRGILEVSGADRLGFLNNLLTNQTWDKQSKKGLEAGKGVYAFLLNNQGRIVADMNVMELGERAWLEMDARLVEVVREALGKYVFSEKVKFETKVGELHELFLTGPRAGEVVGGSIAGMESRRGRIGEVDVVIFRDDVCGVEGYRVICEGGEALRLWKFLSDPREDASGGGDDLRFRGLARPVGWAAFNTARIEAGRALFGVDFDSTVLPAETGSLVLSRAVSFTKGCYLGQEVVARMHARGQVARQVVGFKVEGDALPVAGAQVMDDEGNVIGQVTSSTPSPMLSGAAIGMAMVKKPFFSVGAKLNVPAEGASRKAVVVEMPFVVRA